jgi:hypothetical protein
MSKAEVYSCDLVSRTVPWRRAGDIDRYWYEYRVSRDAFRYPSYALRKHVWERGLWGGVGKQWREKTKAIKCGAFSYSIVTNAHRVTRIAATLIIFTRIGCTLFTCHMYMCRLRHINDSVLSSLKMEGIRLLFFYTYYHCVWLGINLAGTWICKFILM